MRARSLLAIAMLVVPALADAQRIPTPRVRDRGPARPAPLPPTAGPIARETQYVRLPYTVESYPLISYFRAPGFGSSNFANGGAGERLDLRVSGTVSLTLDLTQSFIGGPVHAHTAELGVRLRPQTASERKSYPFLDARGGFVYVAERELRPYDYVDRSGGYYQAARGVGGVAAAGVEFALHPRFTLTTAGSVLHANVAPITSGSRQLDRSALTALRYSIGLRYNPGRWVMPANLPQRITQ